MDFSKNYSSSPFLRGNQEFRPETLVVAQRSNTPAGSLETFASLLRGERRDQVAKTAATFPATGCPRASPTLRVPGEDQHST